MDNASYHSRHNEKVLASNSRKGDMQDWLMSHGIKCPKRALKRDLLSLIKLSNPKAKYVIDEMAKAACYAPHHIIVN